MSEQDGTARPGNATDVARTSGRPDDPCGAPTDELRDESRGELPTELRRELRVLRNARPDAARLDATFAALRAADAVASAKGEPRRPRVPAAGRPEAVLDRATGPLGLGRLAATLLPSLAVAAAAVGVAVQLASDPTEEAAAERALEHRIEHELDLLLPGDGHGLAELVLAAEHHDAAPAHVVVDAPEHVAVHVGADAVLPAPCDRARCTHRLEAQAPVAPLRVAIGRPGDYVIQVRHESERARVVQRFRVRATRAEEDTATRAETADGGHRGGGIR
jgi:hypothetical protein